MVLQIAHYTRHLASRDWNPVCATRYCHQLNIGKKDTVISFTYDRISRVSEYNTENYKRVQYSGC